MCNKWSSVKWIYLAAVSFLVITLVLYPVMKQFFVEVAPNVLYEIWQGAEEKEQENTQTTENETEVSTSEVETEALTETETRTEEEAESQAETKVEIDPSLSKPILPTTLTQLEVYQQDIMAIPTSMVLDVPVVRQYPQLPTGCESVALTMALKCMGFDLEKTTIAKDYLVRSGSNYGAGYVGNPFSEKGAGIFPPGLTLTANLYLQEQASEWEAKDISGVPFEELYEYVAAGYPVVLWTTMYFQTPEFSGGSCRYGGRTFRWYNNEHCVVLGGYDLEKARVTIYDPLQGKVTVKAETIQNIYEKTGANAMVICEGTY